MTKSIWYETKKNKWFHFGGEYEPTGDALYYLLGKPKGPYTAKIKADPACDFVYLYKGKKKIWECNSDYFSYWFKKVKP